MVNCCIYFSAANLLQREKDEVGGVLANLALTFDRRIAVNLNYTVSSDVMNQCIRMAGIRHVLTSRKVVEKLSDQVELSSNAPELISSASSYPVDW